MDPGQWGKGPAREAAWAKAAAAGIEAADRVRAVAEEVEAVLPVGQVANASALNAEKPFPMNEVSPACNGPARSAECR